MFLQKLWATMRPTAMSATASMLRPANVIDWRIVVTSLTNCSKSVECPEDRTSLHRMSVRQLMPLGWDCEKGGMSATPPFWMALWRDAHPVSELTDL